MPDITSPHTYSLSLYFGSQRTTGKNPVSVDRTLGAVQVTPCFNLVLTMEDVGCRWWTRLSKSGGGRAGMVSESLATPSITLWRKERKSVKTAVAGESQEEKAIIRKLLEWLDVSLCSDKRNKANLWTSMDATLRSCFWTQLGVKAINHGHWSIPVAPSKKIGNLPCKLITFPNTHAS